MLWIPQKGAWRCQHNLGTVGASPWGTAVTTGGTNGTYGTITELISSASFDAFWVSVFANGYASSATASDGSLRIYVGSATEELLIDGLLMGASGTGVTCKRWDFPLYIPAGSRIAASTTGRRVSTAVSISVVLYGGHTVPGWPVGSKVVTYAAAFNGTSITLGATGAEGAWTQLSASSSEDHLAFVPSFQIGNDTTMQDAGVSIDIGVGAATEEEIGGPYLFSNTTSEATSGPFPSMPTFCRVPASTRLVMRGSHSGTADTGNTVALHAVS